ncbi:hypothetical protein WIW89_02090 [Stygiolobus sp. CP850M]|uniref:hypothetical protein n=1 Tax=Stygiolobus sp. CP850M TaxID=3133134 RepID=UPI00307E9FFD
MDFTNSIAKMYKIDTVGRIITNGYLLLDTVKFKVLLEKGVKIFQVTIDGYKDAHDKLRPLLNGKPTFDKIFKNLIQTRNVTDNFFMFIKIKRNAR